MTTYAGFQGEEGSSDGYLNTATFSSPSGVSVGSDGSLYVADGLNHKIRRVYPDGKTEHGRGVVLK